MALEARRVAYGIYVVEALVHQLLMYAVCTIHVIFQVHFETRLLKLEQQTRTAT